MVGPIINCGATTGYKKQLSAASCNWKMDEQWSMAPLFIHFLLTVEPCSTAHMNSGAWLQCSSTFSSNSGAMLHCSSIFFYE